MVSKCGYLPPKQVIDLLILCYVIAVRPLIRAGSELFESVPQVWDLGEQGRKRGRIWQLIEVAGDNQKVFFQIEPF
jgi:hypothetical protein